MDKDKKVAIAARLPIYGTKDAGRRFYKKFRHVAVKCGLTECKQLKSLYFMQEDGDIKVMLGAHVDDLMWACKPGYEKAIEDVLGVA